MERELRPGVFTSSNLGDEPTATHGESFLDDYSMAKAYDSKKLTPESLGQIDFADLQIIMAQLEGLKERVKLLTEKVQKQDTIIEELVSGTKLKFDRFKQAFHRVEEFVKTNMNELQGQFGKLNSKLVSQSYNESKVEQIVEQHNQTVLGFEAKLNKLQKLINDQDMQLLNYKTALDEARKELTRLKRL